MKRKMRNLLFYMLYLLAPALVLAAIVFISAYWAIRIAIHVVS